MRRCSSVAPSISIRPNAVFQASLPPAGVRGRPIAEFRLQIAHGLFERDERSRYPRLERTVCTGPTGTRHCNGANDIYRPYAWCPKRQARQPFGNTSCGIASCAPVVCGKRVLDIACGEGYGTKALAMAGASSVVGVDISPDACRHAASKYGIDARLRLRNGNPAPPLCSVDIVVSFETVEHVQNPDGFLRECVRVLRPGGKLIISTPDKPTYSEHSGGQNPFHCCEMTEDEFRRLVGRHFPKQRMYMQLFSDAPRWSPASVALELSPWRNWRGHWRLTERQKADMSSQEIGARKDPVSAILRCEGWIARLFNPYSVWPKWNLEALSCRLSDMRRTVIGV